MSAKNPLLRPKFARHEQSTPQLVGDDIINIQNIISEENQNSLKGSQFSHSRGSGGSGSKKRMAVRLG